MTSFESLLMEKCGDVYMVKPPSIVGVTIRALRKQKGMRQRKLAGATNVAGATLSKFERGESNASVGTLLQLCEGLDISMIEFWIYFERVKQFVDNRWMEILMKDYPPEVMESFARSVLDSVNQSALLGCG